MSKAGGGFSVEDGFQSAFDDGHIESIQGLVPDREEEEDEDADGDGADEEDAKKADGKKANKNNGSGKKRHHRRRQQSWVRRRALGGWTEMRSIVLSGHGCRISRS